MKKFLILILIFVGISFSLPTPSDIAKEVNAGHYHKAELLLKEVISKDPNSAKAHYMLSQVYYLDGDINKAKQELDIAKKIDPSESFAHKSYLIKYEKKLEKASEVKNKSFGGAMVFFIVGALLIVGSIFLIISSKISKKNTLDIKTKLMEELTVYLENIEKVKTKLSIDLVSLKDDDPAKKDLSNRLNELEEVKTNMMNLLSKLKNNDVQDIQGAYVYFENLKDKLKEIATGVKDTYENHNDLKNLVNSNQQNSQIQNQSNIFGGGVSFFDMLGMMAMGTLMGSMFGSGFGGPTIINNYDINNDNQQLQDIDFTDNNNWDSTGDSSDFDDGNGDSWN